MNRGLARNTISSAIAMAMLAGAAPVAAQGIEEIVVTAQKRQESSQDVPISITALGADTLEQRGLTNSGDLIGAIPGVGGFESPGSRGTTGLTLRGVSGGSPANLSVDPAVAIYLVGVFVGKQLGSAMDVAELERIEVLRGPQGTLYGRNATGGAVNFISRKPLGELALRATAGVGNYDYRHTKVNLDLPAVGVTGEGLGYLAVSGGYQLRQRDGFQDNLSHPGRDFNDMDREAWRIALAWKPTERLSIDYSYDHSELDEVNALEQIVGFTSLDAGGFYDRVTAIQDVLAGARYWSTLPGSDPRIAERWIPSLEQSIDAYQQAIAQGEGRADQGWADFTPVSRNEVDGHALTLSWDLDKITLKSITGYRDMSTYVFGDLEDIDSRLDGNGVGAYHDLLHLTLGQLYGGSGGYAYPLLDGIWAAVDDIGAFHSKQDTWSDYEQWSQELQLIGSSDALEYVFGLYYFDDDARYINPGVYAAPLGGVPSQNYETRTEALAAYGHATWRADGFDQRLALTLGLRYTEEDKDIDYRYTAYQTPFGPVPAQAISRSESFDNISGNLTVAWDLTPDANIYLRYATGYRSGGFNGEVFNNPYAEETIETVELGLKSDWWDRRLRINGSLYTYTWDDVQLSTIQLEDSTPTTSILNAGEAERWGAEVEVTVNPIADLLIGLNYAYINGDFEDYPDVCGSAEPQLCLQGERYAKRTSAPGNQLNVYLDALLARTGAGNLRAYLEANWQDEWYPSALNAAVIDGVPVIRDTQVMDARTLINARLSLEEIPAGDGTVTVSLWGRNLGDDDHPVFSINFGELGPITEQYGAPRTYGLDITYEY